MGSTFTVRLPIAATTGPSQESSTAEPSDNANPCRILVADDQRDARESLAMLLELHGHEVATARDGLEAVEAAVRFRPDLVLLDLGMPRIDGYEACRRIRHGACGRELKIEQVLLERLYACPVSPSDRRPGVGCLARYNRAPPTPLPQPYRPPRSHSQDGHH